MERVGARREDLKRVENTRREEAISIEAVRSAGTPDRGLRAHLDAIVMGN